MLGDERDDARAPNEGKRHGWKRGQAAGWKVAGPIPRRGRQRAFSALRAQGRRGAWLDEVTSSVLAGTYVDPRAGKVSFQRFYADWAPRQVWVP